VTCYDYGLGNLSTPEEDALFPSPPFDWDTKQKIEPGTDDGALLAIEGTPTNSQVDLKFVGGTGDYAVLFKFGQGQGDPDWVVFLVNGVEDDSLGDLTLISGVGNGLSHHTTWFSATSTPPPPPSPVVPEPASLLLMGSGLAAVGAKLRNRSQKKA
jgi:hypothetical protein